MKQRFFLLCRMCLLGSYAFAGEQSALHGPGSIPAPPVEVAPVNLAETPVHDATLAGTQNNIDPELLEARLQKELGKDFGIARADNFLVVTDAPREDLSGRVLTTLILCREGLLAEYFDREPEKPVVVYAFRNGESYRKHLREFWNENPISPYGHYNYVRGHIVFNYETGLGTMVHEMVHALMDPDMPQAPIWIAEGMASLYEQCRVEGRSLRGLINWRLPELQRKLDTGSYTPLGELIGFTDAQFKKQESLHYAEARYFCMFMEQRGLLRQVYRDFRDKYDHDHTGRIFIESAFGKPLPEVEKEFKNWVRTLQTSPSKLASAK